MSNEKQACVICGVTLTKPIMLGESAPKAWAEKNGYDGYQWNELKSRVTACLNNPKLELLEESPNWGKEFAMFFTCMKHTGKEFSMGEEPETNQDKEDA